jgi:tetratricopeptide (TPR) repeat protein
VTRRAPALGLAAVLVLGLHETVAAQAGTAELLQQARQLYERLEIERALPIFRRVVSPEWPLEVTTAQRVEAYKYLGAALALKGKRDSAVLYFRAALERDPFADLDPAQFTPDQTAAFAVARRLTFSVGVRPITETRIDPRTSRLAVSVVTTHAATLRATMRAVGGSDYVVLYDGPNDGVHEIGWDGLMTDGRLAAPGRYDLSLVGRSRLRAQVDSLRIYLDLTHEVEPLEDTLPELGADALLPVRHAESVAGRDLLKSLGVAVGALAVGGLLANDRLGTGREGRVMAGAATAGGIAAFFYRRAHREIPHNVALNATRRAARDSANATIGRRNADRIARTQLLITPATAAPEP